MMLRTEVFRLTPSLLVLSVEFPFVDRVVRSVVVLEAVYSVSSIS